MSASPKVKKVSPFKFFFAVIVVIMLLAIIAERFSRRVKELHSPLNAGVLDLSTCGKYLAAIFKDRQIHLWDWDDLSIDPQKGIAPNLPAMVLGADQVVTHRPDSRNSLVVSRLRDQQVIREIPLGADHNLIHIAANRGRSILAVLLALTPKNEPSPTNYQLLTINLNPGQSNLIVTVNIETADCQLNYCIISDDGEQAVLLGGRDDKGLMILVDVAEKQITWETTMTELKQFDKAAFAPDGRWFFAGGDDLVLYKIQTDSGQVLKQITVDDNIIGTVNIRTFFDLDVSPNGEMVVAKTNTHKGGVWDCESGQEIIKSISSYKIASNMAFSPDSRLLAVSDMQPGGKITITRLPR